MDSKWLAAYLLVGCAGSLVVSSGIFTQAVGAEFAWVAHYDGPASAEDVPHSLILDRDGNVYVTGRSAGIETSAPPCTASAFNQCLDYATISYDTNGRQRWAARFNGTGSHYDFQGLAAVDAAGNVYVTGQSSFGTSLGFFEIATLKYDSQGELVWVGHYNSPLQDRAYALALDCEGDVVVAGSAYNAARMDGDIVTVKYAPDGTLLWAASYDSSAPGVEHGDDHPGGFAIDRKGNIYRSGVADLEGRKEFVLLKYDNSGQLLWELRAENAFDNSQGGSDVSQGGGRISVAAHGPHFDCGGIPQTEVGGEHRQGFLYFAGGTAPHPRSDYLTLKYNSDGQLIWAARYDGVYRRNDVATAIAVDSRGNAVVTGRSMARAGEDYDMVTLKYDPDGNLLWVDTRDGSARPLSRPGIEGGHRVVFDAADNAFVAGTLVNNVTGSDLLVVKLAPDRRELWSHLYNTPIADLELATGLAVDRRGDLYVAGPSFQRGRGLDYTTLKNVIPDAPFSFLRGDCNGDLDVNLTDAVFLLVYNFTGGAKPSCLAACDANGDGGIRGQLSDALYILNYSFRGGLAPPAPFPTCGPSGRESDALLGCDENGC